MSNEALISAILMRCYAIVRAEQVVERDRKLEAKLQTLREGLRHRLDLGVTILTREKEISAEDACASLAQLLAEKFNNEQLVHHRAAGVLCTMLAGLNEDQAARRLLAKTTAERLIESARSMGDGPSLTAS